MGAMRVSVLIPLVSGQKPQSLALLLCSQDISCSDFALPLGNRESSPARGGGQERSGKVERGGEDEAA